MARYTGPVCRICRRAGEKLMLKGDRCYGPKCAIERRNQPPGQRSPRRRKVSDYGIQVKEKQKVRKSYGVLERQFRKMFREANRRPGATGDNLLRMLELRLDNVVYRLGIAESRAQARQLVRHGHITLNGNRADIPSIETKVGDKIGWTERGRKSKFFEMSREWQGGGRQNVGWINMTNPLQLEGEITALPAREDIDMRIDENAIVEYYSR